MQHGTEAAQEQPVMIAVEAVVIAGPETAARLGVPVGSVIDSRDIRLYRSRFRQLLWRLRHRGGRINLVQEG